MPLNLQQATTDPHLRWRLLDTHRQVWVRLLWVNCSFLLGPGVHKVLFVPSKILFPQSCVNSGGSVVGLMATSSKRDYAIPRGLTSSFTLEKQKQKLQTACFVSFLFRQVFLFFFFFSPPLVLLCWAISNLHRDLQKHFPKLRPFSSVEPSHIAFRSLPCSWVWPYD